jgi:ABC-type multidrug transport system permease subunit
MKFGRVMLKNFKLLIRAKASAFTVLVGPLLIIVLIGFAFSGKATYELNLGYHTPMPNNMTADFVDSLKQSNYFVQEFPSEEDCVKKIEQGIIHTCIIFPENFQLNNSQSNEVRFLVDYSRMNLVYKVIESVSGRLDIESKELSYSLTQVLLSRINTTIKDLGDEMKIIDGMNSKLTILSSDLQKARTNTETMKFETGQVSIGSLNASVASMNDSLEQLIKKDIDLINSSQEWIDMLSEYENVSDIQDDFTGLKDNIMTLHNSTSEKVSRLFLDLHVLSNSLSQLQADMAQNSQLNQDTQQRIDAAKTSVTALQTSIGELKKALDKTKKNLESISITSAETIVSPVNTKIEPIMSETSKLTFTFPFLLMLVIMFVALLLSSTLVIFEKSSKAFFRNHITPTRQEFFVYTTFITSLLIIVLQTIIILALANYFLHISLFKNAGGTLLLIFLASAFFIVLGMAIGYLFSTQEGAIMASIIVGSVFLFLSNLVVPLESLSPSLAHIVKYNPYVLASEFLRKSLLFSIQITEEYLTLLILGGAAIIIFFAIIILVGLKNKKRVKASKETKEIGVGQEGVSRFEKPQLAEEEQKQHFKPSDMKVDSKEKMLKLLSDMTRAEFEEQVTSQENKIADWAEKELGDRKLASRLRKTHSRKEMIKILEEAILPEDKDEEEENEDKEQAETETGYDKH